MPEIASVECASYFNCQKPTCKFQSALLQCVSASGAFQYAMKPTEHACALQHRMLSQTSCQSRMSLEGVLQHFTLQRSVVHLTHTHRHIPQESSAGLCSAHGQHHTPCMCGCVQQLRSCLVGCKTSALFESVSQFKSLVLCGCPRQLLSARCTTMLLGRIL